MSEAPLKFPDLPADHPANAVTVVVEPTPAQTDPVAPEAFASTDTPADTETPPAAPEPSVGVEIEGASEGTPADTIGFGDGPLPPHPAQPVDAPAGRPPGISVDGSVHRARSDDDVLTNSFCRVIAGPYTGRYGVFWSTASLGADGWPSEVVVRTRDAEDENIVVNYADIRPDVAGRR